jgi:hypothetical protein
MDPDLLAAQHAAFASMDRDGAGAITMDDLLVALRARGHKLRGAKQLTRAMAALGARDDDASAISFEEFQRAMANSHAAASGLSAGAGVAEVANELEQEFLEEHVMALVFLRDSPMYVQLETLPGVGALRVRAARVVDGTEAQVLCLTMIVVDVVCIAAEMTLQATSSGGDCRNARWHRTVDALHAASIGVLLLFFAQILLCVLAYREHFFRNGWYVFDLLVIGASLVFELALKSPAGRFVLILLGWRIVRIVHGIVAATMRASSERRRGLQQEKRHNEVAFSGQVEQWREGLAKALRAAAPAAEDLSASEDLGLLRAAAAQGVALHAALQVLSERLGAVGDELSNDAAILGAKTGKRGSGIALQRQASGVLKQGASMLGSGRGAKLTPSTRPGSLVRSGSNNKYVC